MRILDIYKKQQIRKAVPSLDLMNSNEYTWNQVDEIMKAIREAVEEMRNSNQSIIVNNGMQEIFL